MAYARSFAVAALVALLAVAGTAPVHALTFSRSVDPAVVQTVAAKTGDTVTVSGKTVNLRSGPSAKSKKIASLSKGTKLQVVEVAKNNWLKVKGAAGDGYVSGRLVK